MGVFNLFKLSVLVNLLSGSELGLFPASEHVGLVIPPSCGRIECPNYDVIHVGDEYEIRRYNSSMWSSTSPIQDISLVEATRTGFLQ